MGVPSTTAIDSSVGPVGVWLGVPEVGVDEVDVPVDVVLPESPPPPQATKRIAMLMDESRSVILRGVILRGVGRIVRVVCRL